MNLDLENDKIIFLDIDGVLNSRTFYYARKRLPDIHFVSTDPDIDYHHLRELDINALALLRVLVTDTKAKIVISSTWRLGKDANFFHLLFKARGVEFPPDTFVGVTGVNNDLDVPNTVRRGQEIQDWINKVGFKGKYITFDDDSDFLNHQIHIPCDRIIGFTWREFYIASRILGTTK